MNPLCSSFFLTNKSVAHNFLFLKATDGGDPKPTDALAGELWAVKRERIRRSSVHGKSPGWDLRSVSQILFLLLDLLYYYCYRPFTFVDGSMEAIYVHDYYPVCWSSKQMFASSMANAVC